MCEICYFAALDLLCTVCGGALRGSYITAVDRRYHIEHFKCSISTCQFVFGAQDSYYEHDKQVFCHYHYSLRYAQRCSGCDKSILKQFVEIFRNGQNQHWHPECYMIHKFWNIRLNGHLPAAPEDGHFNEGPNEEQRRQLQKREGETEEKVMRIWQVLSAFEETAASLVSDMLLHASNGITALATLPIAKFIKCIDLYVSCLTAVDIIRAERGLKSKSC